MESYSKTEKVELLVRLGLTLVEARVFVALSKSGITTAKTIATSSGVAREVVYRVLPKLHAKGVVQNMLATPRLFKAIPFKAACTLLLQRKEKDNRELRQKLKNLSSDRQSETELQIRDHITVIPPTETESYWENKWRTVQRNVDMIIPLNKLVQWAQSNVKNYIGSGTKRKAMIRIIINQQSQEEHIPAQVLSNIPSAKIKNIEYRSITKGTLPTMVVFDKETMLVNIQTHDQYGAMRWLCTNNPALVELGISYFENLWSTVKQKIL